MAKRRRRRRPKIHLLVPALQRYDAIGNDVTEMRDVLIAAGYQTRVFAEGWSPELDEIVSPLDPSERIWGDPDAVLIYHHSTTWPRGEELLARTRNRTVIRYHNVTPAAFFEPYSPDHARACAAGVASTRRLSRLTGAKYWCDSTFNAEELVSYGVSWGDCRILPPLHRVSGLAGAVPDLAFYGRLEHRTVILFAGGIKPNKGHRTLIESFAEYHHRYNRGSLLLLAGNVDERLQGYLHELQSLALLRGVADEVIFTGPVSEGQLRLCYQRAFAFLCASEHEGFCVPLVEAMAFGLPIVALSEAAVPETVGDAGMLFEEPELGALPEALDYLVENPDAAASLGRRARQRYRSHFAPPVLAGCLRRYIGELAGAAHA